MIDEIMGHGSTTGQEDKGRILLTLAKSAISEKMGVSLNDDIPVNAPWLSEKGACFVTLKINGDLRGCIGSIEAYRPLLQDVVANAVAAAFHDPRFPPLGPEEFDHLRIEVSVLGPLKPIQARDEGDFLGQLKPGIDGIIFEYGPHRATFLPQVWEQLPDPREFLAHLKLKAGLNADFWHPDVLLYRYKVEKYKEESER
ncbi:MAG: AmmeMemoRadiSam system protein A [Mariprofundaceae bacterium]